MDRRHFITVLGAGLTAGCTGSDDSGPSTDATTTKGSMDETTDQPTTTDESDANSESSGTKTVAVGDRVDDEQLSMVVRGASKTDEIGEFQQADAGNTFLVVELAVKNTTEDTYLNFSGFLQTMVKDDEDYTYEQTVAATGDTFTGGQLVPGEVARGDLVYEIPDDASGLALQFDFDAVSFLEVDRVTVDLESEADSMADLEQTLRVDVLDVGEAASHGGVSVSVNGVEFAEKLDDLTKAAEGNEFAIVDITTENGTGEAQHISTALQMLTKDGTGRSYPLSISAAASMEQSYDESSALADGEKRRGKVAYEVPKDASPLYWTFEFTLWTDGDKTFWGLR